MERQLKTYISALTLLGAVLALNAPGVMAQTEKPAAKKAVKKAAKKPAARKPVAKAAEKPGYDSTASDDDGKEPDVTGSLLTDYQCDLGASVSIYQNRTDDKHIALRWEKTLYRLRRVETTTGADRFESRRYGLVWIGIPAKGILLDAKKGQQLANECKSPQQLAGKPPITFPPQAAPVAPGAPAATPAAAPVEPAATPAAPAAVPATVPAAAPAPAAPAPEAPKEAVKS
jgi:hypothetical protein